MGILRFIIRRLIFMVVLVIGVSILIFFMINAVGNPIDILLAERPGISPEVIESVKRYYHMDRSLTEQYLTWLGNVARLDFGTSVIYSQPIGGMLVTWGWETIKIQVSAILISLMLAVFIGVTAATRQYSRTDFGIMTTALLGRSVPGFFLGILLILVFSYWLGIFPSYGAYSTRGLFMNSAWLDSLWHMVLPVAMLTYFNTATLTLLIRSNMVDVLRQDFIMAARASGLRTRHVVYHHALKNAFIPTLTYLAILFGLMLGTAPVTETVFTWPGLGYLYITAIVQLDFPVIMSENLIITMMLVVANLLTDVAYVFIDPRIRLE
ncbi:MAG TPA: ABC transporter permease [Candidatus Methylomirabilis sp.]|nr:ABC transporter permease [Candidatus Methylomirabilis sp.]HSB80859.1 ABC transporter permease [Candidatus Methylomirabilis sp.]HSC72400.1 ABC transporter permease [Candidatus Methylomirabilis sp.]